jgi:hypothetical protein
MSLDPIRNSTLERLVQALPALFNYLNGEIFLMAEDQRSQSIQNEDLEEKNRAEITRNPKGLHFQRN